MVSRGATVGGRSLLHFTLWLRTCLKIAAQHILHLDKGHVLSHPSYYKYICAPSPSKLPSCAPVGAIPKIVISLFQGEDQLQDWAKSGDQNQEKNVTKDKDNFTSDIKGC